MADIGFVGLILVALLTGFWFERFTEWRPQLRRRRAIYQTVRQSFGRREGLHQALTAHYVRPLPKAALEWGRQVASRHYNWPPTRDGRTDEA